MNDTALFNPFVHFPFRLSSLESWVSCNPSMTLVIGQSWGTCRQTNIHTHVHTSGELWVFNQRVMHIFAMREEKKKKAMQAQRKEVNLKQDGRSADSKPQPQKSDTDVLIHLPTCYFRNLSVFVLVEVISFWNIWICTFLCFNFCLIGIDVTHYLSSFPLNP